MLSRSSISLSRILALLFVFAILAMFFGAQNTLKIRVSIGPAGGGILEIDDKTLGKINRMFVWADDKKKTAASVTSQASKEKADMEEQEEEDGEDDGAEDGSGDERKETNSEPAPLAPTPSSASASSADSPPAASPAAPDLPQRSIVDETPPLVVSEEAKRAQTGCRGTGAPTWKKECKGKKCKKEKGPCGGRLIFLFMVVNKLYHLKVWTSFFSLAPPGSWRAYIHCKDEKGCAQSGVFTALPMVEKVETVKSSRCRDLVSMEAALFKHAVKRSLKKADIRQKFLLVSDSTLPAKPYSFIYETIMNQAESDFCFQQPDGWPETLLRYRKEGNKYFIERGGKRKSYLVKHSQFLALNRWDADKFASSWNGLDDKTNAWDVPLKSKRWSEGVVGVPKIPSTAFLWYHDRDRNWVGTCADEFAVFATIFGTFEPGETGASACPVNRSATCDNLDSLMKHKRCFTMNMRGTENDMVKFLRRDNGSEIKLPAEYRSGHPFEFVALSKIGLETIRNCTYLFVRKFTWNARIDGYEDVVVK